MKVVGNIAAITPKRENKNQPIELHLDRVEYLTSKKDGRYFQSFDYVEDLNTPLVITGDCLARSTDLKLEEGEYAFHVYDKIGEEYVLNENKQLSVSLIYDFDENQTILSSVDYMVTLSREEFEKFTSGREKEKAFKKGKKRG